MEPPSLQRLHDDEGHGHLHPQTGEHAARGEHPGLPLAAFAQKNFAKSFSNCKFSTVTSLKVSGNEARRFEFTGEVSGMKMTYIVLYVFQGGRAHSLVCGAMADGFPALKPDYEKVIASARME
ncbi:MAG: hypothetical protein MZV49_14070 [Rhodopseudomonas palustris]|nr:hypothetical protein [Rhodopseudomonas palustris]